MALVGDGPVTDTSSIIVKYWRGDECNHSRFTHTMSPRALPNNVLSALDYFDYMLNVDHKPAQYSTWLYCFDMMATFGLRLVTTHHTASAFSKMNHWQSAHRRWR